MTSNLNHYQKLFLEPPRQGQALKKLCPQPEQGKCCDHRHDLEEKFHQSNVKKRNKSRLSSIAKSLSLSYITNSSSTKKLSAYGSMDPKIKR